MKSYIEYLTERKPVNPAQRKKMARAMARRMKSPTMQKKIARAKKKHATPDVLWKRAQKAAKMLILKKAGYDDYNSYPPVKKASIDKMLQKKYAKIPALAKKISMKLKKAETQRLAAARGSKET